MSKNETTFASVAETLNLPKSVRDIGEKLDKILVVGEGGIIPDNKKAWEEVLPEDVTVDMIKKVDAFKTDFFAAATVVTGVKGQNFLSDKKNKDIDKVSLNKLYVNKDQVRTNYYRNFDGVEGGIGNQTKVVRHGEVTGKFVTQLGSSSSASFGRTRDHFRAEGAKLFG